MTKDILFFDVDGTLYNSQKKLPESAKKAVLKAKENGFEVAIATGRGPFMIQSILEELNIDTYVTFNGQYVVYKGEVIFTDGIPNETLNEIIAFGLSRNEPVVFLDDKQMIASVEMNEHIKQSLATLKFEYPKVQSDYHLHTPVYQTLAYIDSESEKEYVEKFPEVSFVRWHPQCCDMLPKGGSKARGIEKLLQHINKSAENVVAFGDGLNDVEMLQMAGTGVAMGNGHPEAMAVADVVAGHVDEDGLAKVMEKLNII